MRRKAADSSALVCTSCLSGVKAEGIQVAPGRHTALCICVAYYVLRNVLKLFRTSYGHLG